MRPTSLPLMDAISPTIYTSSPFARFTSFLPCPSDVFAACAYSLNEIRSPADVGQACATAQRPADLTLIFLACDLSSYQLTRCCTLAKRFAQSDERHRHWKCSHRPPLSSFRSTRRPNLLAQVLAPDQPRRLNYGCHAHLQALQRIRRDVLTQELVSSGHFTRCHFMRCRCDPQCGASICLPGQLRSSLTQVLAGSLANSRTSVTGGLVELATGLLSTDSSQQSSSYRRPKQLRVASEAEASDLCRTGLRRSDRLSMASIREGVWGPESGSRPGPHCAEFQ